MTTHAERVEASIIRHVDRSTEGRDPRDLSVDELGFLGHAARPILAVIQAKCLDCSCYQRAEVRKCTAYGCALWPYRMGTNPFRAPMSAEQRAAIRARAPGFVRKSQKNPDDFEKFPPLVPSLPADDETAQAAVGMAGE